MKIYPSKSDFIDLFNQLPRVPLFGQIYFPDLSPAKLYSELFENIPDSFIFESSPVHQSTTRYSFLGASNRKHLQVSQNLTFYKKNSVSKSMSFNKADCFDIMEFETGSKELEYLPHFWGGWVGYLSYDMAKRFENPSFLHKKKMSIPDLNFFQVDRLMVYEHASKILKFIVSERTNYNGETHYENAVKEIQTMFAFLNRINNSLLGTPDCSRLARPKRKNNIFASNLTPNQYIKMVERAKSYIENGDIYQANLAQRFDIMYDNNHYDLYLKLRKVNPAPFSGYLKFNDFSIVSSSPERLVKLEGNRLETRPIAGTRPRGQTFMDDHNIASELLLNQKEKAEHLMLVDLERNDLGRICEYGSVKVTDLMFLEKFSHVIHIVSNVIGIIKSEIRLADIIQAVFPGGTITGCPKIRCMEIIEELEPSNRGVYSGSFGYIGFNRIMDLNIIIRTIIIKDNKACFHVGAGIVSDSIPKQEYQETLDKAAAMKQALLL